MPNPRLPPLNPLRAFEATARHLSVKNAAHELCVTPGAVSQMLKTLELHLGVALFKRVNRGIFLTNAGQDYLPAIRNALRQIADATKRVANTAEAGILTISVSPSFAAAWLVPRLKNFQDAHPEIDVQVRTETKLADFSHDGVDVAVRRGLGRYPGLHSEHLFAIEQVPVATPALAARFATPRNPADLVRWLYVRARVPAWCLPPWRHSMLRQDASSSSRMSFGRRLTPTISFVQKRTLSSRRSPPFAHGYSEQQSSPCPEWEPHHGQFSGV